VGRGIILRGRQRKLRDAVSWNDISRERLARRGIDGGGHPRKVAPQLIRGRFQHVGHLALCEACAFVIHEEKELPLLDRSAQASPELVLVQGWHRAGGIEGIVRIQGVVTEEVEDNAVKGVGAILNRRGQNRLAEPILGGESVLHQFEFAERIDRGAHSIRATPLHADIRTVQQVTVAKQATTLTDDLVARRIAGIIGSGEIDVATERGKLYKLAAVERQIHQLTVLNDFAHV